MRWLLVTILPSAHSLPLYILSNWWSFFCSFLFQCNHGFQLIAVIKKYHKLLTDFLDFNNFAMQLSHLGDATAPAVTTKTRLRGVWAALLQASKLKGFSRPGLCLVCREETAQCHSRQCLNHHKLRARVQFIWPQYVASAWDAKVSSCP